MSLTPASDGLVPHASTVVNPAMVYLDSLGEGSKATMEAALVNVADLTQTGIPFDQLPWWQLGYEHTARLRSMLVSRLDAGEISIATVNKHLTAIRQVLKTAWRLDLMSAEDYHRAADLESVDGETIPPGRDLSPGELQALFRACEGDTRPAGARDAALLAVLYNAGLRREEAVSLAVTDYDSPTGRLAVRKAKRRKAREVFLTTSGGRDAMDDWLAVRGTCDGPLFVSVNKGGRLGTRQMTGQAVWAIVERRARSVGVNALTPHDFRRTCIGDFLDAGADVVTVQKIVGHSDPATTARYDRRGDRAKAAASELLHIPYRRRTD